jgi:spore maturation protein CgeB
MVVHPGPSFSVADVHTGLVKGLNDCGVDVCSFNLDDRLDFYTSVEIRQLGVRKHALDNEGAVRLACASMGWPLLTFWPDVVIFMSGFYIRPEVWAVLSQRPFHTVAWFTESPYEEERQLTMAQYVDTVVINDPTNIATYRAVNPRTYYMPHSYDPAIHKPGPVSPDLACDFGWVGTAFRSRIDFFKQVDWSGLDVKLAGNWQQLDRRYKLARYLLNPKLECIANTETVRLYQSAKTSLNFYRKESLANDTSTGWAMGPREVELAACETFFLRESRGEGDELFPDAPLISEPGEVGDLLRWWSANDDLRVKTARKNREAIADRTFKNTAARLLGLIDGAPKRIL